MWRARSIVISCCIVNLAVCAAVVPGIFAVGAGIPGFVADDGVSVFVFVVEEAVSGVVVEATVPFVELVRDIDLLE